MALLLGGMNAGTGVFACARIELG